MQSVKKCKFHLSHIEASTNEHNMFHLEPFDRRLLRPERKLASPSPSPPFRPPGCCFRLTKYAIGRNSALFHPGWPIGPWFNQATEPYQTISKQIEPICFDIESVTSNRRMRRWHPVTRYDTMCHVPRHHTFRVGFHDVSMAFQSCQR